MTVDRTEPLVFAPQGYLGLLDEQQRPILDRQPCRYRWTPGPEGRTLIEILTGHSFDLTSADVEAHYVAIYRDGDARALPQFLYPIVGRPVFSGMLGIGPESLTP